MYKRQDYWIRVRKLEHEIPRLRYGIINLHPAKQEYLPTDYDGVVDRKNDIIYHDRTLFDENVAILLSDFAVRKVFNEFSRRNGCKQRGIKKNVGGKN